MTNPRGCLTCYPAPSHPVCQPVLLVHLPEHPDDSTSYPSAPRPSLAPTPSSLPSNLRASLLLPKLFPPLSSQRARGSLLKSKLDPAPPLLPSHWTIAEVLRGHAVAHGSAPTPSSSPALPLCSRPSGLTAVLGLCPPCAFTSAWSVLPLSICTAHSSSFKPLLTSHFVNKATLRPPSTWVHGSPPPRPCWTPPTLLQVSFSRVLITLRHIF